LEATPPRRVLVIEDDPDLGRLLELHLSDDGCRVDWVRDGRGGLELASRGLHDLIVLDLMLPAVDGLDICREVRARDRRVPILILTARSSETDRVVGLELGADDYVTKPFSVRELQARIKALFRRAEVQAGAGDDGEGESPICAGELSIDPATRSVTLSGEALELTPREFELLCHMARHPGRVFTRAQLLDAVWGYSHTGYQHTVNSHINRLRAKVEPDPSEPRWILTVRGVGYRFREI
jgi:DNA-binding response OmpR family regulator